MPRAMRNPSAAMLAAVPALLAGCQDGQAPAGGTFEVRDSAGIRIVENARPPEGSRLGWRIGLEPAVSIGVFEGEEPYMLYGALDGTRLPDGRIVVANRGTDELRVFDGQGNYLATWGREGEGPTDFRSLADVEKWTGDSIMAWYTGAMGMAVYDSAGEFGRTFVLRSQQTPGWLRPRPAAARTDGTLLSTRDVEDLDSAIVELWDADGVMSASLGAHPAEEIIITEGERGTRILSRLAYSRRLVAGIWGDLVVASPTSHYEIRAFGADGTLERIVRRDHVPRSPTEADRAPFVEEQLLNYEGLDIPEAVVEQARQEFETTPFADYFPAFSSVIGDALGHLWVEEYKYPREDRGGTLWTVFDPEGHALGFVETPEGLEVYEIGEDYILGRVRDELDIESIQLWALERSD